MLKLISITFLICFFNICILAQSQQIEQPPKGIVVLTRPQPNYTDIARSKNVEGTVTLKVLFLANGEIGNVIYVSESSKKKKLTKYGLVAAAIAAARQIKFEPPKRNGQPYSVWKPVIYNFDLY